MVGHLLMPVRLIDVGEWNNYELLLHFERSEDVDLVCTEEAMKTGEIPAIDCLVEWTDISIPTLFTAGHLIRGMEDHKEMTLLAIYLKPDSEGYRHLHGTLAESKKLLDRSIKIDSISTEIASRFVRLIQEIEYNG